MHLNIYICAGAICTRRGHNEGALCHEEPDPGSSRQVAVLAQGGGEGGVGESKWSIFNDTVSFLNVYCLLWCKDYRAEVRVLNVYMWVQRYMYVWGGSM